MWGREGWAFPCQKIRGYTKIGGGVLSGSDCLILVGDPMATRSFLGGGGGNGCSTLCI